jgi:squalene-associated FAD-dependent desaturase
MSFCPVSPSVAIIGGGLAGLSAGAALADAGFRVTLFERKPYLGGRASSYEHPATGEVVDNCQHVLLGCCTNLIDFYRRIGAEDLVRWYEALTFVEPGGRRSIIRRSWLPAPLHTAPSFLRAAALSLRDKLAISRALSTLLLRLPKDDGRPFSEWLRAHHQTPGAIEHFWKVVLVSALNEDLDRVSLGAAALVFRESFIRSADGGRMGVPRVPLTELYSMAGDYIRAHQGSVELRAAVEEFEPVQEGIPYNNSDLPAESAKREASAPFASRAGVRLCVAGKPRMFDYAVMAVPFDALSRLLPRRPEAEAEAGRLALQLGSFETSPITGVHLWFDREITELDHAVLLDRTIQWMFHKSRILDRRTQPHAADSDSRDASNVSESRDAGDTSESRDATLSGRGWPALSPGTGVPGEPGFGSLGWLGEGRGGKREASKSYVEVVISSSKSLVEKSRQEIIEMAVRELAEFFPAVKDARLIKATVVKEVHATFSPLPGVDRNRPTSASPWPQVFLAGDWTATGWPATMEGAVRSGHLAADALCQAAGVKHRSLVPDIPSSGLMRLIGK